MGLPIRRLILATNENDVLDEFFRTGRYRPRAAGETHATSSPSMDISKASNFERYVFDVVGRDPARRARAVGAASSATAASTSRGTPHWARVAASGFVSGRSTHADRIATIRDVARSATASSSIRTPPTASRSASSAAIPRVPLVCIETALPAKFAATIREALGREPARPAASARTSRRGRSAAPCCPPTPRASRRSSRSTPRPRRRGRRPAPIACHAPRARQPRCRNLVAGLRLALFLPVTRLAFRVDLVQLLLLFLSVGGASTSAATGCAPAPTREFTLFGAGNEFFGAALLLLIAALLALAFRQRSSRWRCRCIVLAALPVVQVVHFLLPLSAADALAAWTIARSAIDRASLWIGGRPRALRRGRVVAGRRRACGCARSSAACCSPRRSGSAPLSRRTIRGGTAPARPTAPDALSNAGSEPVLAAQTHLLDERSTSSRTSGRTSPISTSSASRRTAREDVVPQGRRGRAAA